MDTSFLTIPISQALVWVPKPPWRTFVFWSRANLTSHGRLTTHWRYFWVSHYRYVKLHPHQYPHVQEH